jgi:hypothetical protein
MANGYIRTRKPAWARWRQEEILDLRLSELGVRFDGTWLEQCQDELYHELERRGLRFRPHMWLSGVLLARPRAFAVPSTSPTPAHAARALDDARVEGGSRGNVCRSSATSAATRCAPTVHRRPRWRRLFDATRKYPGSAAESGEPRVLQHAAVLRQSHPVEDFAETAIWLRKSEAHWRRVTAAGRLRSWNTSTS